MTKPLIRSLDFYRPTLGDAGIDFAEVRVYQPGDDVRTIDWRVTARTQVAHTKVFQEEKERPVLILVDQSASMYFGSQVTFKSVLAAQEQPPSLHGLRLKGVIALAALCSLSRVIEKSGPGETNALCLDC